MRLCRNKMVLMLILFSSGWSVIQACSCNTLMVDVPYREVGFRVVDSKVRNTSSDIIFEGILLSITQDTMKHIRDFELLFEVTDVYKGNCIDTISVWTNTIGGGCGFMAEVGRYSIVFAAEDTDHDSYYAYRQDCWRGASEAHEPQRFRRYRDILIALIYKIDGVYKYHQKTWYWNSDEGECSNSIEFQIKNGVLDGPWIVYNRKNEPVEIGFYQSGVPIGEWFYLSPGDKDYNPFTLKGYSRKTF